ncbi:MAG: hypothetical protein A2Y33_05305 [Spirochaetes bacterium GWF1_51_8]|nr:MAG: hypothetical protein A2Y33_05305 [Spirochaetes bacterium GWF1_51_8]
MRIILSAALAFVCAACTQVSGKAAPGKTVLCFAGDVTFDYAVKKTLDAKIDPFGEVKSFVPYADLAVFNLETAITTNGAKVEKAFNFRSPSDVLELVTNAGFDIAAMANNHSMDYGWIGLKDTIAALKKYKIEFGGAGSNLAAASVPLIKEVDGIKIAFLFYGYVNPATLYAGKDKPGIAKYDKKAMLDSIAGVRTNCDFVVVNVHWGEQYQDYPNELQKSLGHALIDGGADLVMGHHPHVLQTVEFYGGGAIFYSIGNFVFPQWSDIRMRYTALVWAALEKKDGKVTAEYSVMPFLRDYKYCYPDTPTESEENEIIAHWSKISKEKAAFTKGASLGQGLYSVTK